MAKAQRHHQKSNKLKIFLIWLVILAIFAGGTVFLITSYYENTKNNLDKLSYPIEYSKYVEKASDDYNLDEALIYAIIRTESNFDPEAQSPVGAYGIMQVMPSSFEWLQSLRGTEGEYTTEDLLNPEICIDYGCYLLRYFMDTYNDERCAIAAYNAGFVVGEWLEDENYSTDGKTLIDTPYPETSNYIEKVESAKEMYIKLYY